MIKPLFYVLATAALASEPVAFAKAGRLSQEVAVKVEDPRPLAAAIADLAKRFDWIITYEDPPYLYPGDVVDVTAAVSHNGAGQPRVLVPRGGSFAFTAPLISGPGQEQSVLEALLAAYRNSVYPGVFALSHTGEVYHVTPTMARNSEGRVVPYTPILDTRISFEETPSTAFDLVQKVVTRTGGRLVLATVPVNLLKQSGVKIAATNESARTVLLRILLATGRRLSWQLLCDPGDRFPCALNISLVGMR